DGGDSTTDRMQEINRAFSDLFSHALHAVLERPAIMTIQIALPFGEEVRQQRAEFIGHDSRLDIWHQPAAECPHAVVGVIEQPRLLQILTPFNLREDRFRQRKRLRRERQRGPLLCLLQQRVERNIYSELLRGRWWRGCVLRSYLFEHSRDSFLPNR